MNINKYRSFSNSFFLGNQLFHLLGPCFNNRGALKGIYRWTWDRIWKVRYEILVRTIAISVLGKTSRIIIVEVKLALQMPGQIPISIGIHALGYEKIELNYNTHCLIKQRISKILRITIKILSVTIFTTFFFAAH